MLFFVVVILVRIEIVIFGGVWLLMQMLVGLCSWVSFILFRLNLCRCLCCVVLLCCELSVFMQNVGVFSVFISVRLLSFGLCVSVIIVECVLSFMLSIVLLGIVCMMCVFGMFYVFVYLLCGLQIVIWQLSLIVIWYRQCDNWLVLIMSIWQCGLWIVMRCLLLNVSLLVVCVGDSDVWLVVSVIVCVMRWLVLIFVYSVVILLLCVSGLSISWIVLL